MNSQNARASVTDAYPRTAAAAPWVQGVSYGSHVVEEPVGRGVSSLLPLGQAVADSPIADVDVERLGRAPFDRRDLSRGTRQRAIGQLGHQRLGRFGVCGLGRPSTQTRHAEQLAVGDASVKRGDPTDGRAPSPCPYLRRHRPQSTRTCSGIDGLHLSLDPAFARLRLQRPRVAQFVPF